MRIKRNNTLNSIQKKQLLGLAAAVAVAGVAVATVIAHWPDSESVLARESFTDMKNIVEDHSGEDNSFKIVDFIPSKATYTPTGKLNEYERSAGIINEISLELSTDTIGYLVNGQDPVSDVLVKEMTTTGNNTKLSSAYRLYSERERLGKDLTWKNLDSRITYNNNPDPFSIGYQEAYPGTGNSLSSEAGWKLIGEWKETWGAEIAISYYLNNYCADRKTGKAKTAPSALEYYESDSTGLNQGFIYGTFKKMPDEEAIDPSTGEALWGLPENADKFKGYDYVLLTDVENLDTPEVLDRDGRVFKFNNDIAEARLARTEAGEVKGDTNLFWVEFSNAKRENGSDWTVTDDDITFNRVKGYKIVEINGVEQFVYLTRCAEDPSDPTLPYWVKGDHVYTAVTYKALKEKDCIHAPTPGPDEYAMVSAIEYKNISDANTKQMQVFHFPNDSSLDPKVKTQAFLYVGEGLGNYKLTETGKTVDTPMELLNVPVYARTAANSDLLRRYVFAAMNSGDFDENKKDNFTIKIYKVYAADTEYDDGSVNKKVTKLIEDDADLIYLEDGYADLYPTVRGDINLKYIAGYDKNVDTTGDEYHAPRDMSGDVAMAILNKVANENVAIIVDHNVAKDTDHYKDTVYQRLAKILEKENVAKYYNDRIAGKDDFNARVENVFKTDNVNSDSYPAVTKNNRNFVNNKVYINNDVSLLTGEYTFNGKFDDGYAKAGFKDVLDAIEIDNTNLSNDDQISKYASKARAIQYILCDIRARYNDIKILEIQPTYNPKSDLHEKEEGSGKNYTKTLYWQKSNLKDGEAEPKAETILVADREIKITIVRQSVEDFNSSLEDINSVYDMVFIGLDGYGLNKDVGAFSEGKVYTLGSNGYDAVDITPAKKQALFNYMRAGFPIVVESKCFQDGTTANNYSDTYLQSGTNLQAFLSDGREYYGNFLYTPKDAQGRGSFVRQIGAAKPMASYREGGYPNVSTDKKLTFSYDINNGITRTYHDGDTVRVDGPGYYGGSLSYELYYDMNCDGVFSQDELASSSDIFQSNGQVIIDVSDCSPGITPFAFKIFDSENEFARSSLTGFVKILEPTKIKVLQLVAARDEGGTAGYDLQAMYEQGNTLLAQMLSGAEGLVNTQYFFDTYALDNLEDVDVTEYDLIVLGFGPEYSLSGDILAAVEEHIASGKGVVVSSAAGIGSRIGLSGSYLSMMDSPTYSSGASPYKYLKLSGGAFGPKTNLISAKINDGIVSHYPYEVENAEIKQAVQSGQYLLDYGRNVSGTLATSHDTSSASHVTVWYALDGYNAESTDVDSYATCYVASLDDGRHNYYIYSVDNVYYVGQNAYPFAAGTTDGELECKLFVNTLMGAYNSCMKSPRIQIVSGYGQDAYDIESITIPYDQEFSEVGTMSLNYFFRYQDPNRHDGEKVTIRFYYGSATTDGSLPADAVLKNEWTRVFYVVNHAETGAWLPGVEYIINTSAGVGAWPPNTVYQVKGATVDSNYANKKIYVEVTSEVNKGGKTFVLKALDSVALVGAQLFDLD